MKSTHKIILGSLVLIGLHLGWSGCVADVGVEGSVYYGGDPWFHDGPWVDGGGWRGGGGGGYIHPHR